MARADLLIDSVRAGAEGNQELFRRALEALITEERSKLSRANPLGRRFASTNCYQEQLSLGNTAVSSLRAGA
jgi:hypothetical protein